MVEPFRFKAVKSSRPLAAFAFDLCAVTAAWAASYSLRFEGQVPLDFMRTGASFYAVALPVYGLIFWAFGLYRGIWLFASLPDAIRIGKAVATGAAVVMAAAVIARPYPPVPRSVLLLSPLLLLFVMGGARFAYRAAKESHRYGGLLAQGKPTLIIGAGQAGAALTREIARSSEWRLVGMLDDDPGKQGRSLNGCRIFGPISELPLWRDKLHAENVIVALPTAALERQKQVFQMCVDSGVKAMVLPALTELDEGKPFLSRIRSVDLVDLLGRDPVLIDTPHVEAILHDQTVAVTGAGGSIGSELCRQIAKFQPARLVALDQSEFALYRLTEEFSERFPKLPLVSLAGDVKDPIFLEHLMKTWSPSIVFHAAAYKHVPLMEECNAWQAVRNNVLGTLRLARAAAQNGAARFVLVSTDKAVNPTNVMGATKRLAEIVCQAMQTSTPGTAFEIVRFGNVLGSDGSVVPKFQEQIAKGGPVTVTHPEVTRYFMTMPEAAQLVLQASSMGSGGEIYLLDMGKPVRIVELARDLIRLHGFNEEQVKIVYTGLRPGEKLFEELLADDETTLATPHPKLRIARARDVKPGWLDQFEPWLMQDRILSDKDVRRDLARWVGDYSPAPIRHSPNYFETRKEAESPPSQPQSQSG